MAAGIPAEPRFCLKEATGSSESTPPAVLDRADLLSSTAAGRLCRTEKRERSLLIAFACTGLYILHLQQSRGNAPFLNKILKVRRRINPTLQSAGLSAAQKFREGRLRRRGYRKGDIMLHRDIASVLVDEETIGRTVGRIAGEINCDYAGEDKHLLLLGILKGSVVFLGDLMKRLTVPLEIDFMKVSSYGAGTQSGGAVHIILDLLRKDLDRCDILIIEDIIDSGRTLSYLVEYLKLKGAKSVRCCTLLDKPDRREVEFTPDYTGLVIPDAFVVGYGLDYAERYRQLPFIGILKPEVYQS